MTRQELKCTVAELFRAGNDGKDGAESLEVAAERERTVGGLLQSLKLPQLETSGSKSVTTYR